MCSEVNKGETFFFLLCYYLSGVSRSNISHKSVTYLILLIFDQAMRFFFLLIFSIVIDGNLAVCKTQET